MSDDDILLLQDYFDGNILSPADVQYNTGLSDEDSVKVYAAIQRLRAYKPQKTKK